MALRYLTALLVFAASAAPEAFAAGPDPAALHNSVSRAIAFLETAQAPDGSFSAASGPAITAIAATAMMRHNRTPQDPVIARALRYLEGFVREDGGIYQEGSTHRNYETCLAIMCFAQANRNGRYDAILNKAEAYVKGLQWDDDEGHDISSMSYGGTGYGSHSRPDLSNVTFTLDALQAVGRGPEDPAVQKALIFVSRTQNLESPHNTSPFAAKINDGGFYYTPAAGGTSQAGQTPDGGLRSYGSMTYAGLKSMIFAGVAADDPRVEAAKAWIRRHYTLTENPGMGDQGLYYYYHTFGKALDAVGQEQITAEDGTAHDWRRDLAERLFALQSDDGSWVNSTTRWLEGDPQLVTSYALLALAYCKPPAAAD